MMADQRDPVAYNASEERIKELNAIDKDIVNLVRTAGMAIKTLTPRSRLPSELEAGQMDVESRREAFTSSTADYFRLLESISVRLKRQIYALEEADIVPAEIEAPISEPPATVSASSLAPAPPRRGGPTLPRGGLGNLDVSWLNSRADVAGRIMEAELWAKARSLLEGPEKDGARYGDDTSDASAMDATGQLGDEQARAVDPDLLASLRI